MKLKKLIILLCVCMLVGCFIKKEDTEKNLGEEYTNLSDENHFYYAKKDALEPFLEHGTGILFLGFPECPWCQAYVPYLEEVLKNIDVRCAYYNIYEEKNKDREFYDTIANQIENKNVTGEEIIAYDADGLKTIYMPLVLFINEGAIIAFDNETSMEDSKTISPSDYWIADKQKALILKLEEAGLEIKIKQEELNSKGCDTGCEAFENND